MSRNKSKPRLCMGVLLSLITLTPVGINAQSRPPARTSLSDRIIGNSKVTYVDPEFWNPTGQMCWQDGKTNEVWICSLDPQTGNLIPTDGRGTRCGIAASVTPTSTQPLGSWNGPEWGLNQQGLFVYFTSIDSNKVFQTARFGPVNGTNPQLVQLSAGGTNSRGGALPTSNANQAVGAVLTFLEPSGQTVIDKAVWRYDNEPNTDRPIPMALLGFKGPRWLPGALTISTNTTDSQGIVQAALYDAQNDVLTAITNDAGDKVDAIVFDSPELGKRAMACRVETHDPSITLGLEPAREVAFYAEAQPYWTKIMSVPVPSTNMGGRMVTTVQFAEPFVYNGRSYVQFSAGANLGNLNSNLITRNILPTQMYVVAMADGKPVQASSTTSAFRLDPEAAVLGGKLFLYYYSYAGSATTDQFHVVTGVLK